MKEIFDVFISGAGPSGSILGYLLSGHGYKVLIADKEVFPRYKVCAGGIQVRAAGLIPFKIESQIHCTIKKIRFSRKMQDVFQREYEEPLMYTLDRRSFDDFLLKTAAKKGCIIRNGEKVKEISVEKNKVDILTEKNRYHAKIFVGADGANGFTIRQFNDFKKIKKIIGYETEIPVKSYHNKSETDYKQDEKPSASLAKIEKDSVVLDFGGTKPGYLWVFPKNQKVSAGMGGIPSRSKEIKKYLKDFLKNSNIFTDFCEENNRMSAHFIPVGSKKSFISSFRLLATGDAAGLGDGFTGEGLYNAILSSRFAFESIVRALKISSFEFDDYKKKVQHIIIKNIEYSLMISKIFFSAQYIYYKLIKNNENLFKACCKILRGEKTYLDVVNKLKLIKI